MEKLDTHFLSVLYAINMINKDIDYTNVKYNILVKLINDYNEANSDDEKFQILSDTYKIIEETSEFYMNLKLIKIIESLSAFSDSQKMRHSGSNSNELAFSDSQKMRFESENAIDNDDIIEKLKIGIENIDKIKNDKKRLDVKSKLIKVFSISEGDEEKARKTITIDNNDLKS